MLTAQRVAMVLLAVTAVLSSCAPTTTVSAVIADDVEAPPSEGDSSPAPQAPPSRPDVSVRPEVVEPEVAIGIDLPDVPIVAAFAVPEPELPIGWREEGIASWYGPNFAGRPTATGEIFDPSRLTAAHKTLPFQTLVRVINLDNGRSVVVRINDRGPFIEGRIIDLSRGAAEVVGMISSGTAQVRLELVGGAEGRRPVRVDSRLSGYDVNIVGVPAGTLLTLTSPTGADVIVRAMGLEPPVVPGADGTDVWMSESLAARFGAIVTVQGP